MTSPFRTNPSLGPNLHQVVRSGKVWYDGAKQIASPQLGDWSVGDDGHSYIWVEASGAISAAAAPGTQVTITEPAMTAAAGSGGFYAPNNTVMTTALAAGDRFWARKGAL
jgi:hypothetical protein